MGSSKYCDATVCTSRRLFYFMLAINLSRSFTTLGYKHLQGLDDESSILLAIEFQELEDLVDLILVGFHGSHGVRGCSAAQSPMCSGHLSFRSYLMHTYVGW